MRIALKAIATTKGLWVLESRNDEVESVVGGPPAVGVVPQGHEVGPGDDEPVTAHAQRLRVTRDVSLESGAWWLQYMVSNKPHPPGTRHMRPIVNIQVVIAVHLEPLKLQEELLEDGLCLEGDDAVLVPLVPALQHHPVHCPWNVGHKVPLLVLAANLPNWNFCQFIRTMKWNFDKSKHPLSRFQLQRLWGLKREKNSYIPYI